VTRNLWAFTGAAILLLLCAIVALTAGRFPVPVVDALLGLLRGMLGLDSGLEPGADSVLFRIRLPRVAAAITVGAALAAAGAAYQQLFRNPLVSPDILGVSSGAALGAVFGIFLSFDVLAIQLLAFVVGLGTVAIVYAIATAVRGHDPILTLVLAGVLIGALGGAGVGLMKYLADPYNQLPAITFWLLGSLAAIAPGDIYSTMPVVLVGLVPLWLLRWQLDVLSLGDEEARSLGVHPTRVRLAVIAGATLITSSVVAISGVIGWVGLLVPHLARLLVGPRFALLLPASLLLGAGYMLAIDTLARLAARIEIPLGILTAVIGTPVFLWILLRSRRSWQ
jgi:iron complex transport system permease protein